jgi:peptidoglycan-N-acetylglucosamine deacetylase
MRIWPTLLLAACAARPPPPPPAQIEVAVTVDDLPVHGSLPPGLTREQIAEQMLAAFRDHHLPPVYGFVNGKRTEELPEGEHILRRWVEAGHPLGNHTWSHASLNDLPVEAWLADAVRNEPLLERLDRAGTWKMFRYPYLFEGDEPAKKAAARASLRERGYAIAEVTIDADDWLYNRAYVRCLTAGDAAAVEELRRAYVEAHLAELRYVQEITRALAGRQIRHVLLQHIGALDADRMDALLTAYEAAGVRWIDLPTALADPLYEMQQLRAIKAGASLPYLLLAGRDVHPPPRQAGSEDRLDQLCSAPPRPG